MVVVSSPPWSCPLHPIRRHFLQSPLKIAHPSQIFPNAFASTHKFAPKPTPLYQNSDTTAQKISSCQQNVLWNVWLASSSPLKMLCFIQRPKKSWVRNNFFSFLFFSCCCCCCVAWGGAVGGKEAAGLHGQTGYNEQMEIQCEIWENAKDTKKHIA